MSGKGGKHWPLREMSDGESRRWIGALDWNKAYDEGRHSKEAHARFESDFIQGCMKWVKASEENAREAWGALSNVLWSHQETDVQASFTFRHADAWISEIDGCHQERSYYCEVPYGVVPEFIETAMAELGWTPFCGEW